MGTLQALVPVSNRKQWVNWAWIAVAIFQAKSIALSQIAVFLPGSAQAASRVARLRRWFSNGHSSVWALYRPLLVPVLAPFAGRAVDVVLDGTLVFGDRMQIFRLSLVHKNRTRPKQVALTCARSVGWTQDKSGGFDLDHTRILNPQRLERLLLAVALKSKSVRESVIYQLRRGIKS